MAADKPSWTRFLLTHSLMVGIGITMIVPFLWSLATSLKSEAEVFQSHHIPKSITLGSIDGKQLTTRQNEPIFIAKPVTNDAGIQQLNADGKPAWTKGDELTLRIGNPTLQGSPGEQARTRDGYALVDDAGVPVLNNQVMPHRQFGKYARYQDFRKFKKRAEAVLVPRDFDDGANEALAKASMFYRSYVNNWEEVVAKNGGTAWFH